MSDESETSSGGIDLVILATLLACIDVEKAVNSAIELRAEKVTSTTLPKWFPEATWTDLGGWPPDIDDKAFIEKIVARDLPPLLEAGPSSRADVLIAFGVLDRVAEISAESFFAKLLIYSDLVIFDFVVDDRSNWTAEKITKALENVAFLRVQAGRGICIVTKNEAVSASIRRVRVFFENYWMQNESTLSSEMLSGDPKRLSTAIANMRQDIGNELMRFIDDEIERVRGSPEITWRAPSSIFLSDLPCFGTRDQKKINVGLAGYYGFGNYGDELFLQSFRENCSDCNFEMLHDVPYPPYFLNASKPKVDGVDCILIGGGDLVIPAYWPAQYFEPEFLKKPVFICGVGVPRWSGADSAVIERLRQFFQHSNVKFISVRDEESRDWIESHLEPHVPIRVAEDLVCALSFPSVRVRSEKVFGLITRQQRKGEIQYRNIMRLCDRAGSLGYTVRQIILGTGQIALDDLAEASNFRYQGMDLITRLTTKELTTEISKCSLLASMKFHGCVVGAMMGIPSIGLITTDKFVSFFGNAGMSTLLAHHSHQNLPGILERDLQPLSDEVIKRKQQNARELLDDLNEHMHLEVANAA